jgi:glycosyltransferase involved in cell wall biosynthesis
MRIAVFDDIAAHYRFSLFRLLSDQTDHEYSIFASDKSHNGVATIDRNYSSKPLDEGGIRWKIIKNIVAFKRIFFQTGVIRRSLTGAYDIYIFPGEFHILSTWIATAICRMRKRKVVFWGHGLYGNEVFLKKFLRNLFNRLPDAHLLYNERSEELMKRSGIPGSKIFVINNSLDYDTQVRVRELISDEEKEKKRNEIFAGNKDLPVTVFLGRLTKEKNIELLIKSIDILLNQDFRLNCLIVGRGEQESFLKSMVKDLALEQNIKFTGPFYDNIQNGIFLSMADCCVSPGNIGLLAIHSMTFGTPVITHNDMNYQGPEASTVIENYSGELFERNNAQNLAEKIHYLLSVTGKKHYMRNCISLIDEKYNPGFQLSVFNNLIGYLDKMR